MDNIESLTDRLSKSARAVRAEDIAAEIQRQMGEAGIETIYRKKILAQRTRRFELQSSPNALQVEVLHTLLGIELKIGNRRLLCPDLATARYLAVLARLGCEEVAVPYDITQISRLADELESSWHRMMLLVDHFTAGRSRRLRSSVRRRLIADARAQIARLGAGSKYPQFDQKTRRRRKLL
jgi:hypothetical protein